MQDTLKKLKNAFKTLAEPPSFSIHKIAKTARIFIRQALTKSERPKPKATAVLKNLTVPRVIEDPLIKLERDAFRMKAFTLLKEFSPGEKLNLLKQTPIKRVEGDAEVQLRLDLETFLGEKIELRGVFKRHTFRKEQTAPVPGSFEVIWQSEVTGFPHPLLHCGWALSPKHIHDPEILQEMDKVKQMLKPGSKARGISALWIQEKTRAFNSNHLKHLREIIKLLIPQDELVDQVFGWVKEQPIPYETISAIHEGRTFGCPFIQKYQQLYHSLNHPAFGHCAMVQFKEFMKILENPPSSNPEMTGIQLSQLLTIDYQNIKLTIS